MPSITAIYQSTSIYFWDQNDLTKDVITVATFKQMENTKQDKWNNAPTCMSVDFNYVTLTLKVQVNEKKFKLKS